MTRINVVPVECLTDKHLLAEFYEITRPFNKVIKRINNNTMSEVVIPSKYCLGKGHETFFFDKLLWLYKRYHALFKELCKREFNVNSALFFEVIHDIGVRLVDTKYWNDWNPTPEDMYLNMARLCKRSKLDNVLWEMGIES